MVTTPHGFGIAEGPGFGAYVSPGGVRLVARDLARAEKSAERAEEARKRLADAVGDKFNDPTPVQPPGSLREAFGDDKPRTREVVRWSAKSRRRMTFRLASLDYAGLFRQGMPAMVTLTYPARWFAFAPDGRTVKRHLSALRRRYERRYGIKPFALWKLEFQHRGAPHLHLLMPVPHGVHLGEFREWVALSWNAIICDGVESTESERYDALMAGTAVDMREGFRMKDVKRIAVYFSKHSLKSSGDKEYQHIVPEEWQTPGAGPGRFWGVWGLVVVEFGFPLDVRSFVRLRRILRRYSWANGRRRVMRGGSLHGGWVVVNDASAFASQLSRALSLAP